MKIPKQISNRLFELEARLRVMVSWLRRGTWACLGSKLAVSRVIFVMEGPPAVRRTGAIAPG